MWRENFVRTKFRHFDSFKESVTFQNVFSDSSAPASYLRISSQPVGRCIIDITATATIGRFRLIDCVRYTRDQVLCIEEYEHVSGLELQYSAISYVWKGNIAEQTGPPNNLGEFSMKGAEDGDPISLDVLHHVCAASIIEGADRVWLDRLCRIQASRDDKAWQIARMYDIYKLCKVCIILPGGINHLVSDEEETAWITRAWTLQEVTAPKRPMVLFHWERGAGEWEGWKGV